MFDVSGFALTPGQRDKARSSEQPDQIHRG